MALPDLLERLWRGTYGLVFAATVLETLPGIGILIPGQLVVIAAGAAASLGEVRLLDLMVVAMAGALAGDLLAYELGRWGGKGFLMRLGGRLGLKEAHLTKAEHAFANNAGFTMILGRFNPLTRSVVPFAAGGMHFDRVRFILLAVPSAIVWAVPSVLLGYAFGESYRTVGALVGRTLAIVLIFAVILYGTYRLMRALHERVTPHEAAWLTIALTGTALFLLAAEDIVFQRGLQRFDDDVAAFATARFGGAVPVFVAISELGGVLVVAPVVAIVIIVLLRHGQKNEAFRLGALYFVLEALVGFFKLFFERARPIGSLVGAHGYAFPSGHTAVAALFACIAGWFAVKGLRSHLAATLALLVALGWTVVVGLSRITLGVHYFTDVVGGAGLGLAVGGFGVAAPALLQRFRETGLGRLETRSETAPHLPTPHMPKRLRRRRR